MFNLTWRKQMGNINMYLFYVQMCDEISTENIK